MNLFIVGLINQTSSCDIRSLKNELVFIIYFHKPTGFELVDILANLRML